MTANSKPHRTASSAPEGSAVSEKIKDRSMSRTGTACTEPLGRKLILTLKPAVLGFPAMRFGAAMARVLVRNAGPSDAGGGSATLGCGRKSLGLPSGTAERNCELAPCGPDSRRFRASHLGERRPVHPVPPLPAPTPHIKVRLL